MLFEEYREEGDGDASGRQGRRPCREIGRGNAAGRSVKRPQRRSSLLAAYTCFRVQLICGTDRSRSLQHVQPHTQAHLTAIELDSQRMNTAEGGRLQGGTHARRSSLSLVLLYAPAAYLQIGHTVAEYVHSVNKISSRGR